MQQPEIKLFLRTFEMLRSVCVMLSVENFMGGLLHDDDFQDPAGLTWQMSAVFWVPWLELMMVLLVRRVLVCVIWSSAVVREWVWLVAIYYYPASCYYMRDDMVINNTPKSLFPRRGVTNTVLLYYYVVCVVILQLLSHTIIWGCTRGRAYLVFSY